MNEKEELSHATIQLLYKDCLYGFKNELKNKVHQIDISPSTENKKSSTKKNQDENVKKRFLVITESAIVQNSSDSRFKFLSEIIKACKINLDEGIITDMLHEGKDHSQFIDIYKPDAILLFGISPSDLQLPMIFPDFQVQKIGKSYYISAPSLETLEHDKAAKTKLWNCLKQVFSI